MRRRTWALVRMSDVVFSYHVSLPTMISEDSCDTELPHNIFDEEFGPDSKVLPPSRPITEATPISYMVSKVRLCLELGNILKATNRVKNQVHYDEILRLDAKLREVRQDLPKHLKLDAMDCSRDPMTLIIARFNLENLYLMIMCLLHRKYGIRARHNSRYAHSRRSAIEASMEALGHLDTLYRESQPGGLLEGIRWHVKLIATKEFILPAVLILLDLHFDSVAEKSGEQQAAQTLHFWNPEERLEMIKRLERTKEIWKSLPSNTMEAVKASNILELMLQKIKEPQSPSDAASSGAVPKATDPSASAGSTTLKPGHSAAMTLGVLSGGVPQDPEANLNAGLSPGSAIYPTMNFGPTAFPTGRSGLTPDYSAEPLGLDNNFGATSFPLPNNAGNIDDFSPTDFDWVSELVTLLEFDVSSALRTLLTVIVIQDAFENYAQNVNWGPDQSFQFFSGNPD